MSMRTFILAIIAPALLGGVAPVAQAQDVLTIDLASRNALSLTVAPGLHHVHVANMAPMYSYAIHILVERPIPKPLALTPEQANAMFLEHKSTCQQAAALQGAGVALDTLDESHIPAARDGALAAVAAADSASCRVEIRRLQEKLAQTEATPGPAELAAGAALTVTVSRTARANGDTLQTSEHASWTATFSTPRSGDMEVSYALTFTRDPWHTNAYFLTQVADSFQVGRSQKRAWGEYAPAFFVTWIPQKECQVDLRVWHRALQPCLNLSAGISADFSDPKAFVGFAYLYHDIVSVSAGLAMTREPELRGQYHVGDFVHTNLSDDQLTEQKFRPGLYLGLLIRTSTNIFKKQSSDSTATAPAPPGSGSGGN